MHIRREIDGQVCIQSATDPSQENSSQAIIPEQSSQVQRQREERLRELEQMRAENEKLRSEIKTQKNEISVLRGERDSLMKTISKLDVELTEAEYQRTKQVPTGKK